MRLESPRRGKERPLSSAAGFSEFYEINSRGLLIYFARRVFAPEVAIDLTAESFAQAFLSRGGFRGSTDNEAVAWLYGIARNLLSQYRRRGAAERNALRRLGVEVPELSQADHDRIEELAGSEHLRTAARNGMNRLSRAEREAIHLRIVEELAYPEVASRLAISEQAARARVSRGLRTLAAELENDPSEEGSQQ